MVALRSVVATLTAVVGLLTGGQLALAQSTPAQADDTEIASPPPTALLGQVQAIPLPIKSAAAPAALTWKTSAGTVANADEDTTFQLPKTSYPQVALIAAYDAVTRNPVVRRVLLIGSPTVEVLSEPNVKVTVVVGERTFGPALTDKKGLARLKIEVSPGVSSVKTLATDSYGNVTEGMIALNPPPFPRVLVLCA